jgi:hypothetical protein
VRVDEAGHEHEALGVDPPGVGRHGHGIDRPHGRDCAPADHDRSDGNLGAADRDHTAAHEGRHGVGGACLANEAHASDRGEQDDPE